MSPKEIRSFRDLDTWKVAMDLAVAAYDLAARLPPTERFELSSQIRRAAVSIPANVAEGYAVGSIGRCIHHVRIALGSQGELQTHFELARRLRFLSDADLRAAQESADRVDQLLHGLLRAKRAQRAKAAISRSGLVALPALAWLVIVLSQ